MTDKNNKTNFVVRFYKKHPIISNLILVCVASLVLVWIALIFLDVWTSHGDTKEVPDVKQLSYETALATLEHEGFSVQIADSVYDDRIPPGTVIETWPRGGAIVKPGREVFLTITSFEPQKVIVSAPLKDISSRQAMSYLESLGIKNVRHKEVPSQFPDLVVSAKYNGKEIQPGMVLPVNALIELEIGVVPVAEVVDVDSLEIGEEVEEVEESSGIYD